MDKSTKPFTLLCLLSSSMAMDCPSAVKKSTTSNIPFVIVPVLSLNKMLREPAVSIPSALRTNTLWSSILLVFCMSTSEIINGNPSGTAQTIITTAKETASTILFTITSIGCPKKPPKPPFKIMECVR